VLAVVRADRLARDDHGEIALIGERRLRWTTSFTPSSSAGRLGEIARDELDIRERRCRHPSHQRAGCMAGGD
jgi:hypothetical protein